MKKRILQILIVTISIILSMYTRSFALDIGDPEDWKPTNLTKSEKFESKVGIVLGGIRNFGIITSVISFMLIGIRSMFGSLEEKSEYKQAIPTHIVGVSILLLATTLPDIIYRVASQFNK